MRRLLVGATLLACSCQPVKVLTETGGEGVPEGEHSGGEAHETGEIGETGETGEAGCPALAVEEAPPPAQLVGALDPLRVRVEDADGLWLSAEAVEGGVALGGVVEVEVSEGLATFDALEALGPGLLEIDISVEGCAPGLRVGPLVVGEQMRFEPAFLPGARVGVEYLELGPWEAVEPGGLPPGLTLEGGWLAGVPEAEGAYVFEAAAREGSDVVRYGAQLPVFPSDDALADPPAEPSEPGPYTTASLELSISEISTSRGTARDVAVRVAFPEGGAGPFPLVVFHHAAHSPSEIYDDYTELHDHWASHGYVVASVDGSSLVSASQSWQNLTDMSSFQLATMERLLDESEDETSALAGQVDPDLVFVAGHSRGGGASLISLWREPSLAGAICFAQVSPLQTPSQDWEDPDGNGDRPFPVRPVLILAAGDDLDEPWPLPQSAYDQTLGPAALVTLHGTNHEWTYDAGTSGSVTSPSDISWEERHALDQAWSTAFLERFARADLRWESSLFAEPALSSDLSARGISVTSRRHLDGALDIDDFSGDEDENLLGGENAGASWTTDENAAPYTDGLTAAGRGAEQIARIDAWTPARRLGWDTEDATLRFALAPDGEPADLGPYRALTLRLSAPCDPPPGDCEEVAPPLSVALIDAEGAEIELDAADGLGALGVVGRHWSQLILPLDDFAPLDLSRVVAVELRAAAATPPDDEVWVDDLRLE